MGDLALPYFDQILEVVGRHPDSELATAFERHVHWGCFDRADDPDDSLAAYLRAAEELTRQVCEAAGVDDGMRVLDVGCGFGGTLDRLDVSHAGCTLVGLNIDGRQLRRARELIGDRGLNRVALVEGDACRLPFGDQQFDAVLAVECAFHFPSRKQFLREVARVLRPGGRLALSDFMCRENALGDLARHLAAAGPASNQFYGANAKPLTWDAYTRAAGAAGLSPALDLDLTDRTLPTYAAMRRIYRDAGLDDGVRATDELEAVARLGYVQYHVFAFGHTPG